ncbi:hypothetical protein HCB37_04310 [Listeria booriae]|uniref:hypothetical protein n=1 Tax=Listeria booriae TaxID=1552123 RepID=UPI00162394AC|nr:hypothetical protein [Listeria booriae]MBC2263736.1 hypothetical protein [Listeria booriae]
MKTSEFKQAVEEIGLDLGSVGSETSVNMYMIFDPDTRGDVATIFKNDLYGMRVSGDASNRIGEEKAKELFDLLTAYASTPLDEREEPKKWYLRDPVISDKAENYLNYEEDGECFFCNKDEKHGWQTKFTRAEIDAFEFEHAHLIEEEVTR